MFNWFKRGKKRTAAMQKIASQMKMSFVPVDEYGTKTLLRDFKLFQQGGGKRITNLLHRKEAESDLEVSIFDYRYVINTGKSSVPFHQTVFFVNSKSLDLPQFLLKPENFFHRIGTYLGMQDIDFSSHPEFSHQYLLQGEHEDLIRERLDSDFRHFFTVEKNWSLEGLNYFLIFYQQNKLLPPEEISTFYQKGKTIYELLQSKSNFS